VRTNRSRATGFHAPIAGSPVVFSRVPHAGEHTRRQASCPKEHVRRRTLVRTDIEHSRPDFIKTSLQGTYGVTLQSYGGSRASIVSLFGDIRGVLKILRLL